MNKRLLKRIGWVGFLVLIILLISMVAYNSLPETRLPQHVKVDKIEKGKRLMHVYSNGKMLKTYVISLGFKPSGKKRFEYDGRTPEGKYFISGKNSRSIAYKSLSISYPNKADLKYAAQRHRSAGGDVMIHGMVNGMGFIGKFHRLMNWTGGCIGITNNEMDDLFAQVDVGCEIEIVM
jgi:murein L,D-transpeptidase YafK